MHSSFFSALRVFTPRIVLCTSFLVATSAPVGDLAAAAGVPQPSQVPVAEPLPVVAPAPADVFQSAGWQPTAIGDVNHEVFALALRAASTAVANGDVAEPRTLTVIDFSKSSTEKRMWVYDLKSRTLLFDEVVSHGRGSGVGIATQFSNQPESYQSSLGLYRTAETYVGKHGYSLRLDGLDAGFNDRARERAIVMHAADYVNPAAALKNGYLGRSLGCPALRPAISRELIDTVKEGGLLFAYYPDEQWLKSSKYLG